MPSFHEDGLLQTVSTNSALPIDNLPRKSHENTLSGLFTLTNGNAPEPSLTDQRPDYFKNSSLRTNSHYSAPHGTPNGSIHGNRERSHSKAGSIHSMSSAKAVRIAESGRRSPAPGDGLSRLSQSENAHGAFPAGMTLPAGRPPESSLRVVTNGEQEASTDAEPKGYQYTESDNRSPSLPPTAGDGQAPDGSYFTPKQTTSNSARYSSPPTVPSPQNTASPSPATMGNFSKLAHRHTLQVPKISTAATRTSRDFSFSGHPSSEEVQLSSGRFSPTNPGHRRASLGLMRRPTRSLQSEFHLDDVPQDEDAARWTEAIRQKRASRRKRKEEEDDERVIVGTKVDQGHVNWVTAYNMLTGIRFTVSRTNAKMDRELTDADFEAKHKFSFDVTGNELTPSAKYDFKFKDYAPWVFRHLRAKFRLDPADYLMSLTSKYILSELGSPGKSGSFFYFSRDYKYIIKTIHHAEHKLLRKVLREYYNHIENNPNTLLSQFYGLHRVKIPFGRKIHFVVMNNLFPPHRDIHQMFDLKGSTIGRDFREEDLGTNPRATLKDLNWLRRNLHLELGPGKKEVFIAQMKRDVTLLQRLKIMDYSLLVGKHDLQKGNEEMLRDKTLQVFQPGGERSTNETPHNMLMRTPSRLENAKKARELRLTLKKEKPVPMGMVNSKMPDEMLDERKERLFYNEEGGFRATHENGQAGEEIYYLGIIDCLTHYGIVKKLEHFWKGLSHNSSQISPIRPEPYGDRFVNFITGNTMTKEEADREEQHRSFEQNAGPSHGPRAHSSSIESTRLSGERLSQSPVEKTLEKAQKQAHKTELEGRNEEDTPERVLGTARSPSAERTGGATGTTLPVVEEAGEAASTGERSAHSGHSQNRTAEVDDFHWRRNDKQLHNGDSGFGSEMTESPVERHSSNNSTTQKYLPDPPKLAPRIYESPGPIDPEKAKGRKPPSNRLPQEINTL
ncbi:MAG: hypothetical protein Q9160_000807 [Pyrenula sp. 1 TL-2023]